MLSKIVHASRITFVMQDPKGSKGYAFAVNRKSFFTNIATIRTTDKKGKSFLVDIDLKNFA